MTSQHDEEFLPPAPVTWLQKLAIGLIGAALLLAIGMSIAHGSDWIRP